MDLLRAFIGRRTFPALLVLTTLLAPIASQVCDPNYGRAGANSRATGIARTVVVRSVSFKTEVNLEFGVTEIGTGEEPSDTLRAQNASFIVSGEPRRAFQMLLPDEIMMTHGDGSGPEKKIRVTSFSYNPPREEQFGAADVQRMFVGATRAHLLQKQSPGDYNGVYLIMLIYP